MTGAERIRQRLEQRSTSEQPAIVAYLTAGFPNAERFCSDLCGLCEVADVVEVGIPFTDPLADGVTIQRASQRALEAGVSLSTTLDQLSDMASRLESPILLMSYLNPLLSYGLERLAEQAEAIGVGGFIVPDLPLEESPAFRAHLETRGLALVQMVTPETPEDRIKRLCEASSGFVYAVTRAGITGGAQGLPEPVLEYLDTVRKHSSLPVCAGFGIRAREQVRAIAGHADGVVVGSAIVEAIESGEDPRALVRVLRGSVNRNRG